MAVAGESAEVEGQEMIKNCAGCGPQDTKDFYGHPKNKSGLQSYCKTCLKKRSSERELRIQAENRANGLPIRYHRDPQRYDREMEARA